VTQFTRDFLLGLTTLAALLGLVGLLMLFGEMEGLLKPRYALTVNCTNALGLRAGSGIELNGVPIGQVDEVLPADDPRFPVRILALVDRSVRIPAEVKPFATSSLLGGSATLQLEGTAAPGGATLPTDGTARIDATIRSRLIEQITSELDDRMDPVVDAMRQFEMLARNLNELLEPPVPERPVDVRNIRTAVIQLNELLVDVREALALAKSWLGDEQLRADARDAVHNANLLIEQATATLDEYTKLASRLEADTGSIRERLMPVFDELASTLEEVRGLARKADSGEGTVAELLNNPDLYHSLDDAADRLEQTLREVQLLLDKIKDDGMGVVF
jgi:phospholipid/cholesterol/gamma-HCH transport system substrate-binding protein